MFNLPLHVRKLIAECPQSIMGVLSRRYADPLKYASRGSTLNALTVNDCVDSSVKIAHKHTAEHESENEREEKAKMTKIIFVFEVGKKRFIRHCLFSMQSQGEQNFFLFLIITQFSSFSFALYFYH